MAIDQRKLISALRMMPDPQLYQVAQAHKADPYIFPPVFQESQRRQMLRSGMSSDDKSGNNPVPVNEQALMAMAPQQGAQPMPESVGLGALPMKSDPFAKMAAGGIVAFAGGGKSGVGSYEEQIRAEAVRQGVDPDLMVRMFATESAGDSNAVSPKGAAGLGQLMIPAAKEMGLSPEERFDPEKNIPAAVGYFKKQLGAFGGDPEKAAAAYNWGPGAMRKHLATSPEDWKLGLPKETANYLTKLMPVGTAQAAPQLTGAAQIPTGGYGSGPTPPARDDRSYFGKLADEWGIPQEYQRNINNTLSALGGFSMPVAWASKAANLASKGLEPTAEAVANAARLKQVAETPRLMAPAKAGLEGLDQASQAARASAVAARQARGLEADVQAAKGAQQSVDAATKTAQIARATEEAMRAKNAATGINAAKVANVGRGVTGMQAIDQALREGTPKKEPTPFTGTLGSGMQAADKGANAPLTEDITPAKVIDAAKSTMTPEEQKESGYSAEDWLTLGFALLGGTSPNTFKNFSDAFDKVQTRKMALAKAGLEALDTRQKIALAKAQERKYGAESDILESGSKAENMLRTKAAMLAAGELKNWMMANVGATQDQVDAQRQKLISYYTNALMQDGTMPSGATAGVVVPQGVSVTRIG